MNIKDVATQLREFDKQFVNDRDNVFARMAQAVEDTIQAIEDVDNVLRVDAAEYVPAIRDAFDVIDKTGVVKLTHD